MENTDIKDTNIEVNEDIKVDEPIETPKAEEPKPLTFTQVELDTLINKRLDRASKKAGEEKAEAEKLAKMSEADRQIALFEAEKVSFAEERKLYQREKLELQVVKELSTKSLPTEFSKYLIGEDAETCMSNIKEFDLHWQQAIANVVDARLRGNTPKSGSGNVPTVNPWKEGQINLTQQGKIWRENHELARTLMNNN